VDVGGARVDGALEERIEVHAACVGMEGRAL
jgi:hypothetical protein